MVRPRILLLNKLDLIDSNETKDTEYMLKSEESNLQAVLHCCCKNDLDVTIRNKLAPCIMNLMKTTDRYHRNEVQSYNILVIGIPNVGKSSLINALRNIHLRKAGKATAVGAKPGITRSVMEKIKISENPKIYVLDTPGILSPSIPDMDVAMKLALCATIPDSQFEIVNMADYLLFTLNLQEKFEYVNQYGLLEPIDDVYIFLTMLCKKYNLIFKFKNQSAYEYRPHYDRASQIFIRDFREGRLGKVNLDYNLFKSKRDTFSNHLQTNNL